MRIAGVGFPARFRFSQLSGQHYRHYIELTVFGHRLLTVDEWFVDGHGRLELPFGVREGPNIDQGANLAAVGAARDGTETFTVTFEPASGLLRRMCSMRFKGAADAARTGWINEVEQWAWTGFGGRPLPLTTSVTWADERTAWARLRTDDVIYNADLTDYLRQAGP